MKILTLAGSPKGPHSVTRQYVHFLAHKLPEHTWRIEDVGQRIRQLERDPLAFSALIDQIREADLVLWAFPVYFLLIPAGLKRFIELIHERGVQAAFAGKRAASLSTSIHFFDHCAHDYLRGCCEDLGMAFVDALSLEMNDLTREAGRRCLLSFGHELVASTGLTFPRQFAPATPQDWDYTPGPVAPLASTRLAGRKAVLLHDATDATSRLTAMVAQLKHLLGESLAVHNIRDIASGGHCLGCMRCAAANRCVYERKDDFVSFYNEVVKPAEVLILAGTVTDRYLSAVWKNFFDRSFFNGHVPMLAGKQLAFVLSGPLSQLPALQTTLAGYADVQRAHVVALQSDESGESAALDRALASLAERLVWCLEAGYHPPQTFLGVAGHKLFRDEIYENLRFIFLADHRHYAQHGLYDFPTRRWAKRLQNALLVPLMRVPAIRKVVEQKLLTEMLKPLKRWAGEAPKPTNERGIP